MKSAEETIGASTVWVQSFETRRVSRLTSHTSPLLPVGSRASSDGLSAPVPGPDTSIPLTGLTLEKGGSGAGSRPPHR